MRQTLQRKPESSPRFGNVALWDSLFSALEPFDDGAADCTLTTYRFTPTAYIEEQLGWTPWSGSDAAPGQQQIIDAYTLALRQMHERRDYEAGTLERHELQFWLPGQVIKNWLRVEAGHTVGKTKLSSGLVNHFFDCFPPAIVYTFAPSWPQIKHLLWKEIETDRGGKDLPGKILEDCQIKHRPNHFAIGKATNDNGGRGTERVHGQHGPYLMFVIDEAEGVPDFVFNAIRSMASGGIVIVLMLANPRTRLSTFHKLKAQPNVANFRISCISHPNVLADREIVPGAVRREYITEVMCDHYERVDRHDPDAYTFELPWEPGIIYRPDTEFLFRVLGIAPANVSDNTLIPVGRYEAACQRRDASADHRWARLGVDVARWGKDYGTLYARHAGTLWRAAQFYKQDSYDYWSAIRDVAITLAAHGVESLHIRIDAGGGFGSGVIDLLSHDVELIDRFREFVVIEVHFGGRAYAHERYADLATEMYAEMSETLGGIRIVNAPEPLEADLCERRYEWINRQGMAVKRLVEKKIFKKDFGRSPDDGDGAVLAAAPDHIFGPRPEDMDETALYDERISISDF